MQNSIECDNISDALRYIINISKEIAKIAGHTDRVKETYYSKCLNQFNLVITKKSVTDYNPKKTPHEDRFPTIKNEIRSSFFELFMEDLNKPIFKEDAIVDGKKKKIPNDDWLKINDTISLDDTEESEEYMASLKKNRGLSLVIAKVSEEERKAGKIDIELPLSEIYMAAIYIFKNKGIKNPHYPLCVIYGIYQLIKHSLTTSALLDYPIINRNIEELMISGVLVKVNDYDKNTQNKMKEFMRPMIESNKAGINSLFSQIKGGIRGLSIEEIDSVSAQAKTAIQSLQEAGKDFKETIGNLMGCDQKEVKEKMEKVGLCEGNIRSIIDNVSGSMTNEELQKTVPTSIDDLLNPGFGKQLTFSEES